MSRFLAQAFELARSPTPVEDRQARLARDIGQILNVPAVEIKSVDRPARATHVREAAGTVAVPVPGVTDPPMEIALRTPMRTLDPWSRQSLGDIARIAALVLRRAETSAAATEEAIEPERPAGAPPLIGTSAQMVRLRHEIRRMAGTDFTVLVEGESGSGKELVARLIHEQSPRHEGPFIGVNCAALVETLLEAELFGIEDRTATGVRGRRGKFELASSGTLFLDEVADLSPGGQAKLLRAIQERAIERVGGHTTRTVNARIVAATNQSLRELVAAKQFRADLFYRLSGVEIYVPPLRTRPEDISTLAHHFLDRHRAMRDIRFSAGAMDALLAYPWPGNVRELERVIERAVTLATTHEITLEDLPPKVTGDYAQVLAPSLQRDDTMRTWGSRYARIVLERCHTTSAGRVRCWESATTRCRPI